MKLSPLNCPSSMKNTHLQHPEDAILTGDLTVLDWFTCQDSQLSTKIDGAPAIVWGTNPATGKFFVGTKSVFNKVKVKINETHEEIEQNHTGTVAEILHYCLDCLPPTPHIIQCDFIGFGGDDTYTPNTLTYVFRESITQDIIVAPHTIYLAESDLRDAVARPIDFRLLDTPRCKFIQPKANMLDEDFTEIVAFTRQMSCMCEFLTPKQSARVQKQLNACIREGIDIDDLTQDAIAYDNGIDVNVLRLWKLVKSIKEDMLFCCYDNGPDTYIYDEECLGEGYVRTNQFGMFKLVNREVFSHANFTMPKSW